MTFVVTLARYEPLPRDDGIPWTRAQIQEATLQAGPWTLIDTVTLSPVDADPSAPQIRDLSTASATIDGGGWYRIIWVDSHGGISQPTPPVQDDQEPAPGWRPTVGEVASRLRARTKIPGGKEQGVFTSETRPTADQVEELIDEAVDEVLGKVQAIDTTLVARSSYNAPGSDYERRIRRAVALYTAILIELSYFPEQVRQNLSPVTGYQQLYDSRIRALIAEGETGAAEGMGQGASGAGDAPADAAWSFPEDTFGALVGWESIW
jgi:hypothetical protein